MMSNVWTQPFALFVSIGTPVLLVAFLLLYWWMRRQSGEEPLTFFVRNAGAIVPLFCLAALICIIFVPLAQSPHYSAQIAARSLVVQVCGGIFAIFAGMVAIVKVRQNAKDVGIRESTELTGRYFRAMDSLGLSLDEPGSTRVPVLGNGGAIAGYPPTFR